MKYFALAISVSVLATACSGVDRTSNNAHTGHNMRAGSTPHSGPGDHNSMDHGKQSDHEDMRSSPNAASAPFDLQFIDTMIVHHQGAIDMAMLAGTRAQHQEIKELAADIIDSQEREIARMSQWRDRWFGEKPKAVNMELPGMSHGMGGMDKLKLAALNGKDFDVEFLRQMIPHHEGAVQMAKSLQMQDSYSELKGLAGDIITAQEAEIRQMRDWLAEWQK